MMDKEIKPLSGRDANRFARKMLDAEEKSDNEWIELMKDYTEEIKEKNKLLTYCKRSMKTAELAIKRE